MDQRLQKIQEERKLQGVKWKELAENLPISSEGLRIAFSRGSVDPTYLKVIEEKLHITKPTTENKEKTPREDARFEDLVAQRVLEKIGPLLNGNTERLLKAVLNLQMELDEINNKQEKTQQTVEAIEQKLH